jgi:hypothetical protein
MLLSISLVGTFSVIPCSPSAFDHRCLIFSSLSLVISFLYTSCSHLPSAANQSIITRMAILGTIEYCWNVFPSTFNSSFALFLSNLLLFMAVCLDSSEDAERAKIGKKQN